MKIPRELLESWDQIIEEQLPNFLRLYINPHVVQTCLCLSRYVQETWYAALGGRPEFQSFLANSFDEALSGAIKLARFCADAKGQPKTCLILDPLGEVGPFISVPVNGQGKLEFIPDILIATKNDPNAGIVPHAEKRIGFVVVFPPADLDSIRTLDKLRLSNPHASPLLIACVSRSRLDQCRQAPSSPWGTLRPDIVVFDESFVRRQVPFGAFTAHRSLYAHWNRRKFATFHSTTFQPNTIASLHFLRCLEIEDPVFFMWIAKQLKRIARDRAYRTFLFARLYSPALAKMTTAVGWNVSNLRAAGHYIHVRGRPIFDGVAGVACSIRGHNPPNFRQEIDSLANVCEAHRLAAERLQRLTGLGHLIPAVSGASAVENALRLGLVAQYRKPYVLAFSGGFGGKTLLALTGTANSKYKARIDPLYENVVYVNPFQERALIDLKTALRKYPVGVVQLELIQGVGGVRPMPERVVRFLQTQKDRWGYLLFVDEVQTGMFRTGPFLRSQALGVEPDLLTLGKGVSDMMFPFSVTLYSNRVQQLLHSIQSSVPDLLRSRFDYEFGYKTLINVLDRAEEANVSEQVRDRGALIEQLLSQGLSSCKAVRSVRVFGLLIGIELETKNWPWRWFRKQCGSLYVLNLLRHEPFPLLAGFCQYEPHVLKLTPPLSITREEVERMCATLTDVLRQPPQRLVPALWEALIQVPIKEKLTAYWNRNLEHEYVTR